MSDFAVERARQIFQARQSERRRQAHASRLGNGDRQADPDVAAEAGEFIGALHIVHSRLRHLDGWLRDEHQLNLTEMHVLSAIPAAPAAQREPGRGDPAARLAREVELSPSGLTRLVDRLVTRGLLARVDDVWDKRVTRLVLTDRGRAVRDVVLPQAMEQIRGSCGEDQFLERLRGMAAMPEGGPDVRGRRS
jgi:DNA-binding MarR family transcriptional regulator